MNVKKQHKTQVAWTGLLALALLVAYPVIFFYKIKQLLERAAAANVKYKLRAPRGWRYEQAFR